MTINVQVFGAFMKDWIGSNVKSTMIITIKYGSLGKMTRKEKCKMIKKLKTFKLLMNFSILQGAKVKKEIWEMLEVTHEGIADVRR